MHWKRTAAKDRRRASFRHTVTQVAGGSPVLGGPGTPRPVKNHVALTIASALERLERELHRLGATEPLLSSNVPVGLRGMPQSRGPEPADPGVAVYVVLFGKSLVFAADRWDRVADNIAAIAQH